MIENFSQLVTKLLSTSGRLEKERFLLEYKDDDDVKFYLWFLYNPYIVTGVSTRKLSKGFNAKTLSKPYQNPIKNFEKKFHSRYAIKNNLKNLRDLLEYFKKNNTGRDVDLAVLHEFADQNPDHRDLIYGLVKKDLKLGVQEKTLNKVFGDGYIPTLNVMLAESYHENIKHIAGREFIVSLKVDGVRALLMFNEGNPIFFTRAGRTIDGLVELNESVASLNPDYVYDGELLIQETMGNAADRYRATVRITASDNPNKSGLTYHIFDRVLKSDFVNGSSSKPALERKRLLEEELKRVGETCGRPLLKFVPMLYIGTDTSKIDELLDTQIAAGEEGVMVSPADSPYECKRTKNLLKVKKFHTADVLVKSLEEGTGANIGKLGAVHVEFIGPDGKLYTCKVGSGFKLDERELYWNNPELIIDSIIEIGYFELSKNQNNDDYSLRFPTFKHLRTDKSEISMH